MWAGSRGEVDISNRRTSILIVWFTELWPCEMEWVFPLNFWMVSQCHESSNAVSSTHPKSISPAYLAVQCDERSWPTQPFTHFRKFGSAWGGYSSTFPDSSWSSSRRTSPSLSLPSLSLCICERPKRRIKFTNTKNFTRFRWLDQIELVYSLSTLPASKPVSRSTRTPLFWSTICYPFSLFSVGHHIYTPNWTTIWRCRCFRLSPYS